MAQILWGDGTGLGCSIVLYCMTTLCTYLIRTRWGVSDLLHYQAHCNKARRERERGREKRQGKGRLALEHSAMSPDQPFPTGRVCMGMGEGLFLVCTSLFAFWTDASVGFSHPRTLHARRVRVACLLFVHQTLPVFFVCVFIHALQIDVL